MTLKRDARQPIGAGMDLNRITQGAIVWIAVVLTIAGIAVAAPLVSRATRPSAAERTAERECKAIPTSQAQADAAVRACAAWQSYTR